MNQRATLIFLSFFTLGVSLKAALPEREMNVGISGVHAPTKISAKEDLLVIVNGVFQNACYRWKRADEKHLSHNTHEIRTIASVTQGMCLMVLVPFQKEISIGQLSSGRHHLRFQSGDGTYLDRSVTVD